MYPESTSVSATPGPPSGLERRRFLALASSALVSLAGGARSAEPAGNPEFAFAFVTDTHLGRSPSEEKTLPRLVDAINRSPAVLTLFGGDLVDNGQEPGHDRRYPAWKEIVKGLKKDWYAVAGNHDPDELFCKHVQAETDFSVEQEGVRFVCFRDAQPNPGHDGLVTPEQLRWLQDQCDSAGRKGQRVILVAHVIYHENKHPDVGWYVKEGRAAFAMLLRANPHVVAFLAGHFHCGLRGWDDTFGVQEVVLPSASWNQNRGLDKAPGYSVNEFRLGYVLSEVYRDRLRLHYCLLDGEPTVSRDLMLRS
ncbi:MAG: metallophosphoesterase [Pirellulales bacterium]|nr:metallophosphoesterase [Pirellulales bacterium]